MYLLHLKNYGRWQDFDVQQMGLAHNWVLCVVGGVYVVRRYIHYTDHVCGAVYEYVCRVMYKVCRAKTIQILHFGTRGTVGAWCGDDRIATHHNTATVSNRHITIRETTGYVSATKVESLCITRVPLQGTVANAADT